MKLLANENVPRAAIDALRETGHDVLWARTEMTGAPDSAVLARARNEGRVLLTFDKDFGELAVGASLPAHCGVILLRLVPSSPGYVAARTVEAIQSRDDWTGHFSVVEDFRIRLRPLPRA